MNKLEDFILEQEDFFTKLECQSFIKYFDHLEAAGLTSERNFTSHQVSDSSIAIQELLHEPVSYDFLTAATKMSERFLNKFWEKAYSVYSKKYSILSVCSKHSIKALKIQKSNPGQGYHNWHAENTTPLEFGRFLTFILYLNDVDEGGETEFLYYPKRVAPKEGKLLLFPGTFTHTHRGNQPLSNTKYIITGWVFFDE